MIYTFFKRKAVENHQQAKRKAKKDIDGIIDNTMLIPAD